MTLYFLAENMALTYTTASNVGVIVSAAPLFTAILARFVWKDGERLNRKLFPGLCGGHGGPESDQLQRSSYAAEPHGGSAGPVRPA